MGITTGKLSASALSAGLVAAISLTISAASIGSATAQSCWNHNGSLMRVIAGAGGSRTMRYVTTPHGWQAPAGVYPGTVLFTGYYDGARYYGTARRFSKGCPGNPQVYEVSGPANSRRITLSGQYRTGGCAMNGRLKTDTLVFTFSSPAC